MLLSSDRCVTRGIGGSIKLEGIGSLNHQSDTDIGDWSTCRVFIKNRECLLTSDGQRLNRVWSKCE